MNKQLINKYKPEFNHWLNEGSVLLGIRDLVKSTIKWYPSVSDPFEEESTSGELLIIINDEYVEFRKALAEGKTIQIYDVIEQHLSDRTFDKFGWRDFKSFTSSSSFSKTPDLYRIKPYEPKFKVGDFVTPLNRDINCSIWQIDNILSCNTLVSGSTMLDPRTLQPWTPVKNEWCWFWDKCTPHRPTLRQYDIFPEGYGEENMFHDSEQNPFDFCEPFLNSLPSYLKDK